jgi:hypothetical protein
MSAKMDHPWCANPNVGWFLEMERHHPLPAGLGPEPFEVEASSVADYLHQMPLVVELTGPEWSARFDYQRSM